jgi:hypothetical protein
MQLIGEEIGPILQLVTTSQQQPALFSFDVKSFVAWECGEFRKFSAFASAAITIADLLTQVVQHSAKPSARCSTDSSRVSLVS